MTYELTFNGLDFSSDAVPHEDGYWFEILGADFSLGSPVPVERAIESMLQDGSMIERERDDNREQGFVVVVCAPADDGVALAAGEQALALATGVPCEMAWRGPHSVAATTVFEVVTSRLVGVYESDYDLELARGRAAYGLSISALPFGRSESETVVEALTVGAGSETVISDGTSATGWSSPDGAVTVSSGRLSVPAAATAESTQSIDGLSYGTYVVDATVTLAATDFSATPYLSFEYDDAAGYSGQVAEVRAVYADGVSLPMVADTVVSGGTRRATFFCADSSVTTLRLVFANTVYTAFSHAVLLDNVKRSPSLPAASTTGKESLRSIEVGGSARTQASLLVAHDTDGLGDVVVYSAPTVGRGYDPSLRQFYTGAALQTADADAISGFRTNLDNAITFDVPTAALPRGGYVLYARIKIDAAATAKFNWSAATRIGSTDLAPAQSGQTPDLSLDTTYRIVPIATLVLPPTEVAANSAALVRIALEQDTANTCDLDQLWLFYRGEGTALSVVSAGAGTPALGTVHNLLWLDSATLARSEPSLWVGTEDDKSDALHGGGFAGEWEVPSFPPGTLGFYVATSGAADAEVSGRYYARWHTAAVE